VKISGSGLSSPVSVVVAVFGFASGFRCKLAVWLFAVTLFVRFAWLVKVAVSLFGLSVSACLRQLRWVLIVFGFGSDFRSSFAVWLLPLSCLFAFGLRC